VVRPSSAISRLRRIDSVSTTSSSPFSRLISRLYLLGKYLHSDYVNTGVQVQFFTGMSTEVTVSVRDGPISKVSEVSSGVES
jgi:hypothetical protein